MRKALMLLLSLATIVAVGLLATATISGSSTVGATTVGVVAPDPPTVRPRSRAPRLRPTLAQAKRALTCSGNPRRGPDPVLLLHGTASSAKASWSWNWRRTLKSRGWSHCALDSPGSANSDLQLGGEYVVRAIQIMHRRAGREISIVGHSHGGMIARWALRYWPETRAMVDDYVGLGASNHGTEVFDRRCADDGGCPDAWWQQRRRSAFLKALNQGAETFNGVSYTTIATRQDQSLVPYTSGYLQGGRRVRNLDVQGLCRSRIVEHLALLYDHAVWSIALDALVHRGPAQLSRVPDSACALGPMPGVDRARLEANLNLPGMQNSRSVAAAPKPRKEPKLRGYAR